MRDWERPTEAKMRAELLEAGFFAHFDEDVQFEQISDDLVKLKLYHRGHPSGTIFIEGSVPYEVFHSGGLEVVLMALLAELARVKATARPQPPPPRRERRSEKPPEIIQKRTPNRGGRQAKIDALRRVAKDQAGKPEGETAARLLAKLEGKPAEEEKPRRAAYASDTDSGTYGPGFYRPGGDPFANMFDGDFDEWLRRAGYNAPPDHHNARSAQYEYQRSTQGRPNWYTRAQDLELEKFLERLRNMADAFSNMGDAFGHSAGLGKIMRDELERLEREAEKMRKENRDGQEHKD